MMAKSLLPSGPRITNRAGRDRPRFIRPVERQRMRPWLEEHLDNNDIPGLMWVDKKERVFKIAWKHAANQCFNLQKDTNLFERWAIHTGRHYQSDHKRWKANFRCALNSLPDVKENKDQGIKKGNNAFKVYRFLDEKDTRGLKETKVRKKSAFTGGAALKPNMEMEDHIQKGQQLTLRVEEKVSSSIPILPKLEQLYPTSGVEMLIQAGTDQKEEQLTDTAEDTNLQEILAAATASLAAGSDPAPLENISINQLKQLGDMSRMKLDVRQGVKKNAPGYLYVFLCRWCEKVYSRKIELFQHFLVTHQDKLMAGEEYGDHTLEENSDPKHQKLLEEIQDLEQKVLGFSEKSYQSSEAGSEDILDEQIAANEVIATGSETEEKALDLTIHSSSDKQTWQETALDLSMSTGRKGKHQKQKQGKQIAKRRRSSQETELNYSVKFGNYGIAGTPRTKRQMSLHTRKKEEEQERLAKKLMSTDGTDPSRQHSIEDIVHAEMLLSLKTGNEDGNDNEKTKSVIKKEVYRKEKKGKLSTKRTFKGVKNESSGKNESTVKESTDIDSDDMEVDSYKESENGMTVKAYKCGLCFNKFSTSAMLSRHVESHAGSYVQVCKTCGQEFQNQEELLKHIDSSHSYLYYKCNFCSKVCKTVKKLKNHMWTHILKCVICEEKFYNADLLDIHLKEVHGVDPNTIVKGHEDDTSDESESGEDDDEDGYEGNNPPPDRTDETDDDTDQNHGTDPPDGSTDEVSNNSYCNSDKGINDCDKGKVTGNMDDNTNCGKGMKENNRSSDSNVNKDKNGNNDGIPVKGYNENDDGNGNKVSNNKIVNVSEGDKGNGDDNCSKGSNCNADVNSNKSGYNQNDDENGSRSNNKNGDAKDSKHSVAGNDGTGGGNDSTGNDGNSDGNDSTGNDGNSGGNDSTGNDGNSDGNDSAGNDGNSDGSDSTGNDGNSGGNDSTGNDGNSDGNDSTGNDGNSGGDSSSGNNGNSDGNGSADNYGNSDGNGSTGNDGNSDGNDSTGNDRNSDGNGSADNDGNGNKDKNGNSVGNHNKKDDKNENEDLMEKENKNTNNKDKKNNIDSKGIDPFSFLNIISHKKGISEIQVNSESSKILNKSGENEQYKGICPEQHIFEMEVNEVEDFSFFKDKMSCEEAGCETQAVREETSQSDSSKETELMSHTLKRNIENLPLRNKSKCEVDTKINTVENIGKEKVIDTCSVKNEPVEKDIAIEKAVLLKQKIGTSQDGICFICDSSMSMNDLVAHIKGHSVVSLAKVKDALDVLGIEIKALEKPLYMCNLCNKGLDSIQALSLHVSKHLAPDVKPKPSSPKIIIPRRKRKSKLDKDSSKSKIRKTKSPHVLDGKPIRDSQLPGVKEEPSEPSKRELSSSCSVLAAFLNAGPLYQPSTLTKALQKHFQGKDKIPSISLDGKSSSKDKKQCNIDLTKNNAEDQKEKTIAESLLQGIWNNSLQPISSVNAKGDNTVIEKTPVSVMLLKGYSSNDFKITDSSAFKMKTSSPSKEGRELRIISKIKRGKPKSPAAVSSALPINKIVSISDNKNSTHLVSSTSIQQSATTNAKISGELALKGLPDFMIHRNKHLYSGHSAMENEMRKGINESKQNNPQPVYLIGNKTLMDNLRQRDLQTSCDLQNMSVPLIFTSLKTNKDNSVPVVENKSSMKMDPVTSSKLVGIDINTFSSKGIDSLDPISGVIPAKLLQLSLPNPSVQVSLPVITSLKGSKSSTSFAQGPLNVTCSIPENASSSQGSFPTTFMQGSTPITFSQEVPLHVASLGSLSNVSRQGSIDITSLQKSLPVTQYQTGTIPIMSAKRSLPIKSFSPGSIPIDSQQGSLLATLPQQVLVPVSSVQNMLPTSSAQQGDLPTTSTKLGSFCHSTSPICSTILSSLPTNNTHGQNLPAPSYPSTRQTLQFTTAAKKNVLPGQKQVTIFKLPQTMDMLRTTQTTDSSIAGHVKKQVFLPVINTTSGQLVFIKDSVALSSTGIVTNQTVKSKIPGHDVCGNQTRSSELGPGMNRSANMSNYTTPEKAQLMPNPAVSSGVTAWSQTAISTNMTSAGTLNVQLSHFPQTQAITTVTNTFKTSTCLQISSNHYETCKPTFNLVMTQASTTHTTSCPSLARSIFSQITGSQVSKSLESIKPQEKKQGDISEETILLSGIKQTPNPIQNRLALICSYCKEEIQNMEMITKHSCPSIPTVIASINNEAKSKVVKKKAVFPCVICNNEYEDFEIILSHLREHYGKDSELAQYCEFCSLVFETDYQYGNHMMEYHSDRTFACPLCSKDFFDKKSCVEHIQYEHTTETKCNTCNDDKIYLKFSDLTLHKIFQHPFECMICEYRCDTWSTILYHVLNHAPIKGWEVMRANKTQKTNGIMCKKCLVGFPSMIAFKSHVKVSHRRESIESLKGESLEMCHLCNFTYSKKERFHKHICAAHVRELSYKCGLCEQICGNPAVFISHLKGHLNQGLLEVEFCHHCQKIFPRKLLHHQHMLYHASLVSLSPLQPNEVLTPCKSTVKSCLRKKESLDEEIVNNSTLSEADTQASDSPRFDVSEEVDRRREVSQKIDRENQIWKCEDCGTGGFKSSFQLKQHRVIRHIHPHTRSSPSYYQHVIDNIKKPRYYDCSICGQKLESKIKLRKHLTMHIKTTSGNFLCSNYGCSLKFKTRLACLNHIKVCKVMKKRFGGEKEEEVKKIDCDKEVIMKSEFVSRFVWGPNLLCRVCSIMFDNRIELKNHLMEEHSKKNEENNDDFIAGGVIEDQDLICSETISFVD